MATSVLIERYIQLINMTRPLAYPIKHRDGSSDPEHLLWMLVKMSDPNFVPLTSNDAWLSWVQCSLYHAHLLHIRHEIDITREILGRSKNEII